MVFCPEPCCALCIVSHEARDAIAVEKLVTTGPMRSQEVSKTRLSAQVNTRRRGRGAFRLSSVTRKRPTRKRQLTQQVPRRTHNAHSKCEHKPPCLDFYAIKQRKQKLAHNNTRMHAATHTHQAAWSMRRPPLSSYRNETGFPWPRPEGGGLVGIADMSPVFMSRFDVDRMKEDRCCFGGGAAALRRSVDLIGVRAFFVMLAGGVTSKWCQAKNTVAVASMMRIASNSCVNRSPQIRVYGSEDSQFPP